MQEAQAVLDYCVKIHKCTNVQWAAIYFHLEEENNCGRLPTRIQCSAPNTCHKFLFIAWTKTAIVSVYYACTRHFKERYRLEWTRKARMYCVTGETQSLYHRYLHRKVTTSRMLHFCCCTAFFFFCQLSYSLFWFVQTSFEGQCSLHCLSECCIYSIMAVKHTFFAHDFQFNKILCLTLD